jgi:proteasome lid subunit RPN8/RPN11
VGFDGAWVLKREEKYGDVAGFLHTHPDGLPAPSSRDIRTMRAWCSAFGKPLLCLIACPADMHGYRFDDSESTGQALDIVAKFRRGVVIGVDADG